MEQVKTTNELFDLPLMRCGTRLDISAPSILMHKGVGLHSPGEGMK
jgi:hypothetical protein